MLFQAEQVEAPEAAVLIQPTIEFPQGLGIEPVNAIAAFANFRHQARVIEYAQMFGDGRTADVKAAGDFVDRLSATSQAVENGAAGGVGDSVKNINA